MQINSNYAKMLQSPVRDCILRHDNRDKNKFQADGMGVLKMEGDKYALYLRNYNNLTHGLTISAQKLLDVCVWGLTEQNTRGETDPNEINTVVEFSLRDYMKYCNIPPTESSLDKTRRNVKNDIETLMNLLIDFRDTGIKTKHNLTELCRVIGYSQIKNSKITVTFIPQLAIHLLNAYITYYPLKLLQVDGHDDYAFYIGRQYFLHRSIRRNQAKGTADILSVKTLLNLIPNIPTEAQLKTTNDRHYLRRIKDPFETSMDKLADLDIFKWRYCKRKKQPLTSEDLTRDGQFYIELMSDTEASEDITIQSRDIDFKSFMDAYILFEPTDYPMQPAKPARKRVKRLKQEAIQLSLSS